MQPPGGVPLGLEDGLGRPAGQQPRRAGVLERREPQLGPVPGHVGVVPAGPGEAGAVGAGAGEGVEVAAAGQHPRRGRAVERQRHDLVRRFALAPVHLAHADDGGAVRRHPHVGVAQGRRLVRPRRDRNRLLAEPLSVEALVGEVDEEDEVGRGQRPGAATVLVDAGADVDAGGGDVFRGPARRPAHQGHPAALVGPPLAPPDAAVGGQRRRPQPPSRAGHRRRRDRRAPGPVGSDLAHAASFSRRRPRPRPRPRADGACRRRRRSPARRRGGGRSPSGAPAAPTAGHRRRRP